MMITSLHHIDKGCCEVMRRVPASSSSGSPSNHLVWKSTVLRRKALLDVA
jgi:hypothetical protein